MKPKSGIQKSGIQKSGFKLFLLTLPFLAAVFIFSYLPLHGWIYAFFDYRPGLKLSQVDFTGFKYFTMIVSNAVRVSQVTRVLRNTFAMSFLGILFSPLPMIFALLLTEIRSKTVKRLVQTLTTIPNFISWVLVYAIAFAMFSTDGFINRLLVNLNLTSDSINFLASNKNVWMKMLGYTLWKGLGWSAIMYLATIATIDQELYEAAVVDGANRFQKVWHITIPGLLPTYFVLLLLSIGNFINNGIDMYYVFQNPLNKEWIEVLDLYIYNQGFGGIGSGVPFATAVGMIKSLVSVVLLFTANKLSQVIRKEKIF